MKAIANFKKGSNDGYVELVNTTVGERWLAVTAIKSKMFKTVQGAERFMNAAGYSKI